MSSKTKILLVDDEKIIRTTLAEILKKESYNLEIAERGKEALKKINEECFNIIIVDIKLPDMNGLEVLRIAKEKDHDICGIIITAYPSITTAITALKNEAYDYIIKPFDVDRVKFTIKKCLEKQNILSKNNELIKELSYEKEELQIILQIGSKMSSMLNLEKLSDFIIDKACDLTNAEKGSLMLIENDKLVIKGAKGLSKKIIKDVKIGLGQAISGWVFAKYGKPLLVKDIENDIRIQGMDRSKGNYRTKSFLSLPLKVKGKSLGVVNITDKIDNNNIFNKDDLKHLSIIINQSAVAIENARLCEELSSQATTDDKTNVYNYRYFKMHLFKELARAERYSFPLSLIMIDIDNFKEYNDVLGHIMGDNTLKDFGQIFKKNTRSLDIVCRYGGDEFCIILPHADAYAAYNVAEKIRKSTEKWNFSKKTKVDLAISIGISVHKKGGTQDELIKQADIALYRSKEHGRNISTIFSGE
ncbi:MAG: diguanylate cyclase [Spirochaetes bacterium]|nr:diguanylate cyclase [Spirochaetota bacterium]